ncbi:MAG TPA: hypothetical protein VFC63_05895 [Blastocatellia bacterium]|nr:hypothetical protein [Blastocatellia bacterium]
MKGQVIVKLGSKQAVESAIDGLEVLWIKDLGDGRMAAAVVLPFCGR